MNSSSRRRCRLVAKLTALAISTFVIAFPMLRWFEHRQVYIPDRQLTARAEELGRPHEEINFVAADDVKLHGWFFPAETNSIRADRALLVMHGNAGNIGHRLHFCQAWLELGLNVFIFDYRGYGRSEGEPSEEGTYLDAQAAYHWLRQRGFAANRIVALGKSLGGGIASELAVREPLGGLVLQNTFTSVPDLGSELFPWLPVRRLAKIRYDTNSKLPRIAVPVLIAHSREDRLIAFRHGEQNFASAKEPKSFLELRGDHNDTLESAGRKIYLAGLEKFLRQFVDGTKP